MTQNESPRLEKRSFSSDEHNAKTQIDSPMSKNVQSQRSENSTHSSGNAETSDRFESKSLQSNSSITFHDESTLPIRNHISTAKSLLKRKSIPSFESRGSPPSEFDDETRSSLTKVNDIGGSRVDSPDSQVVADDNDDDNDQNSAPLSDFFATQGPVVVVDMIDQSITSGLGTEASDAFTGSSLTTGTSIPKLEIQNNDTLGASSHSARSDFLEEKDTATNFPSLKDIPEEEDKNQRRRLLIESKTSSQTNEPSTNFPSLKNIPEEEDKNHRRSLLKNNIPQSEWPSHLPNINEVNPNTIMNRNAWASNRLYSLFRQKHLLNDICAECSVQLRHADSIYASFYMNPQTVQKRKRNKLISKGRFSIAKHRRSVSIEDIIGDLGSDFDDQDEGGKKAVTFLSSITEEENDRGNRRDVMKQGKISSSKSGLDDSDLAKQSKSRKAKKKGPSNNKMYHIVDFKKIHSCFAASGAAPRYIPQILSRKEASNPRYYPRRAFIQKHGVFTCKDCAFAHNILGRRITTVKSVYVTTSWSEEELTIMETCGGNLYSKHILGAHAPPRWKEHFSINGNSSIEERIMYVKAKYELFGFLYPVGPFSRISKWEALMKPSVSNNDNMIASDFRLPDRLIDYFCVVGATRNIKKTMLPTACAKLTSDSFSANSKHIELQPKVWDCYPLPENSHSDMPLPAFLPNFAFPNGCRPSSKKKDPHFFNFVLTMEFTNAKVYGSALMVYEDIVYLDQIMDVLEDKGFSKTSIVNGRQTSLQEEHTSKSKTSNQRQKLFLPKVLIVLSHYPLVNLHRAFLQQIYLLAHSKTTLLPIERYVSNFCTDIPLPPQGQVAVNFGYFDEEERLNVSFSRPAKNDLPLVGFSFRPLFTSLSVSNVLVVFACLSQELRVVLCSKHPALLTPVAESFRSILFPFVWQGIYIPLLPYSMIDILQSPEPYLVGIHSKYLTEICKSKRPNGVVFVDLDKDIIHLGFEEGETASMERRTPKLPDKEIEKLKSKLDQFGGLAYLPPTGGQKGRLTSGLGLETVLNADREKYAHQTTMSAPPGTKRGTSSPIEAFGQLRAGILAKVDEAYVNDEHLRNIYFPDTSLGMGAKFMSSSNKTKKKHFKRAGSLARDVKKEEKKRSLLDSSVDEKGGFSATEIRQAFVRFFAVVLRNYEKYLIEPEDNDINMNAFDGIFDSINFLKKASHSNDNTWDFLSKLVSTRMFDQFIRERLENPELAEIMVFDETIVVRKNFSKKNKLKGGLKKTPFLSDKSDWDLEPYIPPSPSASNLPLAGASSYKKKFPRLRYELFSTPRKTKQWPQESYQRRTAHPYLFYDEMLSKIFFSSPFSYTPERDLHWSIMVMSYRQSFLPEMNVESLFRQHEIKHIDEFNLHIKASTIAEAVVPIAKKKMESVRHTTMRILWGITKLQGLYRMHGIRNHYRNLLSSIILLQNHTRDFMFRTKYGSTFRGVNARATDIQRIFRGYLEYRKLVKRKQSITIIQSAIKTYLIRKIFLKIRRAATVLASYYRVRHDRLGFQLVRDLVSQIQAQVRGYLKRKEITALRKERLLSYRTQLFELWRRSATPLSYRSKFWKLFGKNCFLYLALHEEELARVWQVLGIHVSTSSTVYEKCQEIQKVLNANKVEGNNDLVPIFPAELATKRGNKRSKQKEFLKMSKIRLCAERQKLYGVLDQMETDTRKRVFKLFHVDEKEIRKKERIVKCLWEYRSLIKPSITLVLNIYDEYGNLQNAFNNGCMSSIFGMNKSNMPPSSILRRFDLDLNSHGGKTYDIVRRCTQNMTVWVQNKLDERVQYDIAIATKACFDALHSAKKNAAKLRKKSKGIKQKRSYKSPSQMELVKSYLELRRSWSITETESRKKNGNNKKR